MFCRQDETNDFPQKNHLHNFKLSTDNLMEKSNLLLQQNKSSYIKYINLENIFQIFQAVNIMMQVTKLLPSKTVVSFWKKSWRKTSGM